ncbi:tRNA (guanosine(37)-N1)-methyltransferase TrmD [Ureaplasma ceti]|uniref:tRNA (guanine-N(1)-)-methyltransferase n=1 Tax=Ureaplasma ceti TaxID=3119530 RepID=A0ABP9U963_9BACT
MSIFKISFVTIFPDMFKAFCETSIIKHAILNKKVEIECVDFRDYSVDKHHKVDDYQYGGGPGMVLALPAIVSCIRAIKTDNSLVWLTTPKGKVFNQEMATHAAKEYDHLIIISGHYEGFDERIIHYIDEQVSIGDYILTGGELPSMVMADSIIRLLDGVINSDSLIDESFNNYLLDYPVYTKPVKFEDHEVPAVLLSGNHQKIADFRLNEQIAITKQNRPDLYEKFIKLGGKKNGSIKN